MFSNFLPENRAVYEIMSKVMAEPERPQMTIWRRVACWTSRATRAQAYARAREPTPKRARAHTHTQKYIILLAFPRQQWFRKRASILRYAYIACLVCISNNKISPQ